MGKKCIRPWSPSHLLFPQPISSYRKDGYFRFPAVCSWAWRSASLLCSSCPDCLSHMHHHSHSFSKDAWRLVSSFLFSASYLSAPFASFASTVLLSGALPFWWPPFLF